MTARSEFRDFVSDVVNILEKQVPLMTRKAITDFLEVLNTSEDESLPVIILGIGGKLMFKYPDGKVEVITDETIRDVLDYEEFLHSGMITLRKAS